MMVIYELYYRYMTVIEQLYITVILQVHNRSITFI